ncbi:MAG TPA: DUF4178 domain-containing protein [Kofleriaceae bacterium]|nr:DUF4178 domain-containing protein [Kofleriaceae bacterium]
MLVWIIIALIVTIAGAAGAGVAVAANGRKRLSGGAPLQLPSGEPQIERTLRELRTGDVVTLDGRDFLTEGVIGYDEDGHRWTGARVVDGADVRWLVVGLERSGASTVRVCTEDSGSEIAGYPPEALVLGETRYALDKRGTATCKLDGDVGTLAPKPAAGKSISGTVERCRWWLYNAAGDDTAVVEQWGADFRILRGKRVGADTIDLMPGS